MTNRVHEAQPVPIQPVDKPIICSPYQEPTAHWFYNEQGEVQKIAGRRPASYWFKTQRVQSAQLSMFAEEIREDLPLVNALREDVKRWRKSGYEGATQITKELLRHWWREDRLRRLFFCQLEAVETIIFLNEIRLSGRNPRFKPASTEAALRNLRDQPADSNLPYLTRLGLKMATGSGKTVVMALLTSWAFCNRGKVSSDERFPSAVLVVCPNLTIKERLQVLRPDYEGNYYAAFDLVPSNLRPLLQAGKVLVTNWHLFAPESEHIEGGKSYLVVDKGKESPAAFARRVLGDLSERGSIMVLNDEAHHAWRPNFSNAEEDLTKEEKEEVEEATVWINGLDTINQALGIRFCADLSATPFYLHGSGFIEGAPFPWLVSDFGLVDAIESGIVKIPRLPVSDTTGRPEPKYFRLWKHVNDHIQPGERLPGKAKKPKPEAVYREAEPALLTLAGQWIERFLYVQSANDSQEKTPPVLILVCDNTDIAKVFYEKISGEQVQEVLAEDELEEEEENEDEAPPKAKKGKKKTRIVYGDAAKPLFTQYFANREGVSRTIRIDSKLLSQAESGDPNVSRQEAAEQLRRVVSTVGKPGEPGEQIRCVVSVAMLTEGWDANNVTHVLGLRAFTSQLLCEQVVGRGLRRMDYTPDPATGLLTEEYVDIYGIPFSLIPFKGRETTSPAPNDKLKNHVRALPERAAYEIRFPVVEGYAFTLHSNFITADIASIEKLQIEPNIEPTSVYVKPRVGYQTNAPTSVGPGEFELQDRTQYYASTHLQTIEFEITRQIVFKMVGDHLHSPDPKSNPKLRLQARHQLFPQVLRLVHRYLQDQVEWHGLEGPDRCEIGQEKYLQRIVERMLAAIRPDESQGEPPLMPILNRYKPLGTTAEVDFKTTRPCYGTQKSHLNLVVTDTATWEGSAAFYLEKSPEVLCYARNDQLGFTIPYDYQGIYHTYEPDFLVRLTTGQMVIVEIKGMLTDQDNAKHENARRWCDAINNWGQLNQWYFHVCRDPHRLEQELKSYLLNL